MNAATLAAFWLTSAALAVPPPAATPAEEQDSLRRDASADNERAILREVARDRAARHEAPSEPAPKPRPKPPRKEAPRQEPRREVPDAGQPPPAPRDSAPIGTDSDAGAPAGGAPDGPAGQSGAPEGGKEAGPPKSASAKISSGLRSMQRALGSMRDDAGAGIGPSPASPEEGGARRGAESSRRSSSPAGVDAAAPLAAVRRPDFHVIMPPARFERLKDAYRTADGPALAEFKHIGATPMERDFVWSASCARVSGDCNRLAAEPSYKRNDYVMPETLAAVLHSVERKRPGGVDLSRFYADFAEDEAQEEADAAAAKPRARAPAGGLRGRLDALVASLSGSEGSAAVPAGTAPAENLSERSGETLVSSKARGVARGEVPAPDKSPAGFPHKGLLALTLAAAVALLAARRFRGAP